MSLLLRRFVESTDAATLNLALTPSGTEFPAKEYVDAATEAFALTPSASDTAQYVDSRTETFALTPSASDIAAYVDQSTETFALTPSGVDTAQFVDAQTETFALTPSATDIAQFVDAQTETFSLTPSSIDTAQYVEVFAYGGDTFASGSSSGVGVTGANKLGTRFVATSPTLAYADLGLVKVGSPTDNVVVELYDDSSGLPGTLVASASNSFPASSLPTSLGGELIRFVFNTLPTLTVGATYWLVASRTGAIDDSNRPAWEIATSGVGATARYNGTTWISQSSNNLRLRLLYQVSTELPRLSLSPSANDIAQFVETNTEYLSMTPSGVDTAQFADLDTELFKFTPSGTDDYTPGAGMFEDSATEAFALTVGGSELAGYIDSQTELLRLAPSTIEVQESIDANTEILVLSPSSTDIAAYADARIESFLLIPASEEIGPGAVAYSDTALLYFRLTPNALEIYKLVQLVGKLSRHWRFKMIPRPYGGSIGFRRWAFKERN